jgi:hypothetical protein
LYKGAFVRYHRDHRWFGVARAVNRDAWDAVGGVLVYVEWLRRYPAGLPRFRWELPRNLERVDVDAVTLLGALGRVSR